MLQRTGEAETITTHYLFALGAYRALYIPNWIYRYFFEVPRYWDPIAVIAGIVQTILYSDFFWIYYTKYVPRRRWSEIFRLLTRAQSHSGQEVQPTGVGVRSARQGIRDTPAQRVCLRTLCNDLYYRRLRLGPPGRSLRMGEALEPRLGFGIFTALRRPGTSTHSENEGEWVCALDSGGACHLADVGSGGYTIDENIASRIYRHTISRSVPRCCEVPSNGDPNSPISSNSCNLPHKSTYDQYT
jgi:hypothetical protein